VDEVKADHESSNKLLGASAEERELVNQKVKGMMIVMIVMSMVVMMIIINSSTS
jgi:hypothetical protein